MFHDPQSEHLVADPPEGPHASIIDRGAFGCVVKALNVVDGRLVAIKMIDSNFSDRKAEYIREVESLARLPRDHPNLIKYHHCDYDADGTSANYGLLKRDRLYTVHEFIDGKSAEAIIQERVFSRGGVWKLPTRTFLSWAQGLYNGLQAMHDLEVLHRDLHYGNVKIEYAGEETGGLSVEASAVKIVEASAVKIVDVGTSPRSTSTTRARILPTQTAEAEADRMAVAARAHDSQLRYLGMPVLGHAGPRPERPDWLKEALRERKLQPKARFFNLEAGPNRSNIDRMCTAGDSVAPGWSRSSLVEWTLQ